MHCLGEKDVDLLERVNSEVPVRIFQIMFAWDYQKPKQSSEMITYCVRPDNRIL